MAAFSPSRLPGGSAPERIVVTNAKGGCGKTTIATNLAASLSARGRSIALYDYDPQGSSAQWLRLRDPNRPRINGVVAFPQPGQAVTRSYQLRIPTGTDVIVADTPAGLSGHQLVDIVRSADVLIVPVLPSPIDIHAAARFVRDLLVLGKARRYNTRLAVIANRARRNTRSYEALERFLLTLQIPFVTTLRDTQHYMRAAEQGLGVHELDEPRARTDLEQWAPLLRWIDGDRRGAIVARAGGDAVGVPEPHDSLD